MYECSGRGCVGSKVHLACNLRVAWILDISVKHAYGDNDGVRVLLVNTPALYINILKGSIQIEATTSHPRRPEHTEGARESYRALAPRPLASRSLAED